MSESPILVLKLKKGVVTYFNLQFPIHLPLGLFLRGGLFQSYWQRLKIPPMKSSLSPFSAGAPFTITYTEDSLGTEKTYVALLSKTLSKPSIT